MGYGATAEASLRDKAKTAGQEEKMMSFRAPKSVREYLQAQAAGITSTILEAVELKRDLDLLLEDVRPELVKAAADLGKEYSFHQAETLAHVIKRCLGRSKK